MKKIVLIDGNSILNRAFYGIMGNKMLTTPDGKYTNAVYGFLAILFKVLEDIEPEYLMVTFDLKAPTARHKLYDGYKATRKGMPNELAEQMPILKDILKSMNIKVIEKEGYEADDVLGTMAKRAEKDGFDVTIVSGDRDTFQLTSNRVKVRIPHTKMGKTETETFGREEVLKKYGVTPKQLIEVKGLQGDTSDNIPGVPGIGEKTALELVKKYKTIDGIYEAIEKGEDDLKPKAKERLLENKELAMLSRILGTINLEVPIEENLEEFKIKEWNKEEVFSKFKELNFNRFIDRFNLKSEEGPKQNLAELFEIKTLNTQNEIKDLLEKIQNKLVFMLGTEKVEQENLIIKKQIKSIYIYIDNTVYEIKFNTNEEFISYFKTIFENENIQKYSYRLNETYVLLMQNGIYLKEIKFDTEIAAYLLNPSNGKYKLDELANQYLSIDIPEYLEFVGAKQQKETQMTLFSQDEMNVDFEKYQNAIYMYTIAKLAEIMNKKLEEINSLKLFENIEMPLIKVLAEMQYEGIYVDKQELVSFGVKLKEDIEVIKQEIYKLAGEEFNINSTLQLGNILFEKLKLPVYKKTKKGYSTDVDILEKLKPEHPIIEKILEYRGFMKLNSTYIEGLIVYINEYTHKIHSYFHQTITATGRISSTEPNLQNIPTRAEQGKQIKKAFKAQEGNIFIDADYSQIELRILAHISNDTNMREAFLNEEDIHKQVASKVFNVPLEEVTKEQRTAAKAVNFGIVYGISGFGLAEQLGISRKKAEQYIEQYLEKYKGVKEFMDKIVEKAKEQGYVETLFHRRRYIPELSSNNYMVRQFGARAAMNTPIQGTAADIMKIAMIEVNKKLEEEKLNAKLILQIHDELLIECEIEEKEEVKKILKESMENAVKLSIPLEVEVSEADNWYDVK
jgi:DNA polymerase-1